MEEIKKICEELEGYLKESYESGITMEAAEKMAGHFSWAQMKIVEELRRSDLDRRMRKNGVRAVRAAVYLENAAKGDKKPSDVLLGALVDRDELVAQQQNEFDTSECDCEYLERMNSIFKDAHIYFRGIAKNVYNG